MSTIDQVSHAIGALEASVAQMSRLVAQHAEATDAMRDDFSQLKTDVKTIKRDVGEMKPTVRKFERYEQRVLGVAAFVSAAIGVAGPAIFGRLKGLFT